MGCAVQPGHASVCAGSGHIGSRLRWQLCNADGSAHPVCGVTTRLLAVTVSATASVAVIVAVALGNNVSIHLLEDVARVQLLQTCNLWQCSPGVPPHSFRSPEQCMSGGRYAMHRPRQIWLQVVTKKYTSTFTRYPLRFRAFVEAPARHPATRRRENATCARGTQMQTV
jgi:hypothetical protein